MAVSRVQPPTTPYTPPTNSTSLTSKVAQVFITAPASSLRAPPLSGTNSEKYDFEAALKKAERTLLKDKRKEALNLFEAVFQHLQKTQLPKTLFYSIRCLLGLASSTDSGEDKKKHALAAYSELKELVESYNEEEQAKDSLFYSELKWHLQKLQPLMPREQTEALMDIEIKIGFCKNHILLIDQFKEKVKEGKELKIKIDKECRGVFEKALALIEKENGTEFQAARIECLLMLTSSYTKDSDKRGEPCKRSQAALFKLYDERASLYESTSSKTEAIKWLINCLESLMSLLSSKESQVRTEVQQRIATCQSELDAIPQPLATTDFTAFTPTSARKVTSGLPNVNNRRGALIISCACFVLVAVVSMAFYRCSVTVSK